MKNIIWLDDQFTARHQFLLEPFLTPLEMLANVTPCTTLREFATCLKSRDTSYHGMILDNMLRQENGVNNYALLGNEEIVYHPLSAGLQIAKVLSGIDGYTSEGSMTFKQPILILTNEHDDPASIYQKEHPDLFDTVTGVKVLSKGDADVLPAMRRWVESISYGRP